MAGLVLAFGKLCFAVVGVAVGWRLVRQVWHEDGVGVHALALGAISVGGVGLITISLGRVLGSLAVTVAGEWAMRAGMILFCAFIAATFRARDLLGSVLAGICATALVAALVWDIASQPTLMRYDYGLASAHATQVSLALPFFWSTIETAILGSRARRRLALGLVEPEVVTRYLLWMAATTCFVLICGLAMLAGELEVAGRTSLAELLHGMRGVFYLVICVCIVLGIFPNLWSRQPAAEDPELV